MIDLNKAPAYFAVLHQETGSHDEAIRRIAAHYYQRGMEESLNAGNYTNGATSMVAVVEPCGGVLALDSNDTPMGRLYGICADDDADPPRLGCHTSWPHQAQKAGIPCPFPQTLPACAGCGRLA